MDVWQRKYAGKVMFICVGCAGPRLASQFVKSLKLKDTKVTVAAESPRWGQLGCNGFIVLDAEHEVVLRSSMAYLQVEELAFRQVEAVLEAVLAGKKAPTKEEFLRDRKKKKGLARPAKASSCENGNCSLPVAKKQSDCGNCDASEAKSSDEISPLGKISKVQVEQLDKEHEECAKALNELTKSRNRGALEAVLKIYKKHFANEEAMLEKHIYAGIKEEADSFNMAANQRKSHFADHTRLIEAIEKQLRSGKKTIWEQTKYDQMPKEFIDKVLRDFENHANKYDDSYAEPLQAALKKAHVTKKSAYSHAV